jgi:dihydrodipicolinate synthase/N-acetylneuraminate lyase
MAQKMASVGADSVLVANPCFYKSGMTKEALEVHYTKVYITNLKLNCFW